MVSNTDSNNYMCDNTWLIDSGSTSHMTGKLDTFHIIHEIGRGHYVNGTHEVRGIGKVIFQLEFNETLELDGVLFVPGLRDNLISVSALENDGLALFVRYGHVVIYDLHVHPIRLVFLGERCGILYVLRGKSLVGEYGWLSDSETVEQESKRADKAPEGQFTV